MNRYFYCYCCCHIASGTSSSSLDFLAGTACTHTFFTFPFIGAMGCEGVAVAVADTDRPGDRLLPLPCCPCACLSAAY